MTFLSQYSKYTPNSDSYDDRKLWENENAKYSDYTKNVKSVEETASFMSWTEKKKSVTENLIVGSLSVYNNTCS